MAKRSTAFQDLCFFPALTLIVFVRRRVGLRLLRPGWIIRTFILLQLYSFFGVALMNGTWADMRAVQWFSLAFVLAAASQYWRSWREVNRGGGTHTFSSGISYLDNRRIPKFLRSHRRIYRIVDPIYYLIVSCYVWILSPPLGLWIALSSVSLRLFEQAVYDAALDRDLDIGDSLAEAEIQQETVEFFSGGQPQDRARKQRALDQRAGIPTGVGPDIESHIAQRRQRDKPNV